MIIDLTQWDEEYYKKVDSIYTENVISYQVFVDEISRDYSDNIYWWITHTASRNSNLSIGLYNISILMLAVELLESNENITKIIVPYESIEKDLVNWCNSNNKEDVVVESINKINNRSKKDFLKSINGFIDKSRRIKSEIIENDGFFDLNQNEEYIIVQTDVFEKDFNSGEYVPRDFWGISDYTDANILVLPYLFSDNDGFERIISNCYKDKNYKFIFREYYFSNDDYKKLQHIFDEMKTICVENKTFQNIIVDNIINTDIMNSSFSENVWYGMLNYLFFFKLKSKGIKIKKLIDWFEAQPSSFGCYKGFHSNYKKSEVYAYVGWPFDEKKVEVIPSYQQRMCGVAPDCIGVIGQEYKRIIEYIDSTINVELAPSFRLNVSQNDNNNGKDTILIALSYFEKNSERICDLLLEIAEALRERGVGLLFKAHPVKEKDFDVALFDELHGINCRQFSGNYTQALKDVSLVITSKSTLGLETIMNGIPVIFVVADMVDFSYLPTEWKGKYYEVVYNATELERAINTLMENNDAISVDSESFIVNPNKDNVGMMMS